jgi:hypothetical protein
MASSSFSLTTWFCFLLKLAWSSEVYLFKELPCAWSLHLKRVCFQERVLEPYLRPVVGEVEPLPEVTGSFPVLLPSFLWICTRLLPFGEMEI